MAVPAASHPAIPGTADNVLHSSFTPESNNMDLENRTGQLLPEPTGRIIFFILCHTDVTLFGSTKLVHCKQLIHFLKESALITALQAVFLPLVKKIFPFTCSRKQRRKGTIRPDSCHRFFYHCPAKSSLVNCFSPFLIKFLSV